MSSVDIILVGAVVLLTFGGTVHFLMGRTWSERLENNVDQNRQAIQDLKNTPGLQDLSVELTTVQRKVLELGAKLENQELRLTDVTDTLEHRFNRLRMRQQRARQEEESEEEEVDPRQLEMLQTELNGGVPAADQQLAPSRGRLVRKTDRRPYGR